MTGISISLPLKFRKIFSKFGNVGCWYKPAPFIHQFTIFNSLLNRDVAWLKYNLYLKIKLIELDVILN